MRTLWSPSHPGLSQAKAATGPDPMTSVIQPNMTSPQRGHHLLSLVLALPSELTPAPLAATLPFFFFLS